MTERIVVGAALFDGGRLLAARRSAPAELAGRWELPGGKVEDGETPRPRWHANCARNSASRPRSATGSRPMAPAFPVRPARVDRPAAPRLAPPRALEDHDALRWLAPGELWDVDWLPQDVPAVQATLDHLATP